ncbi:MAG: CYTH domain-containing protein [Myxococcales bacterium]|nr:CYTH domain-containing protein [Myxococcales bacterium]
MGTEIERKFIVDLGAVAATALTQGHAMVQGYLSRAPTVRVRVATPAEGPPKAWLTVKGPGTLARAEFEYEIPVDDAKAMMPLCNAVITKVRHHLRVGAHVWDVDVYDGRYRGLVVGEIELDAVDTPFERPAWVREEVTDDPRYSNAALALAATVSVREGRLDAG